MVLRFLAVLSVLAWTLPAMAFDHSYKAWDRFLKSYVVVHEHSSQVKYKQASQQRQDLDAFVADIQALKESEYKTWTDGQKQAFLINAYNALTIFWILKNEIPNSIKDTGSFMSSAWKKRFFKLFGEETYLDHIEHDLARGHWTNCRFHFAFNCASVGCPMLRNEAWLAERLSQQFDDSARHFLSDSSRNMYDAKSNTFELSKIFDWYGKDFEADKTCGGSVKAFASRYIANGGKPPPDSAVVKFLPYDWSLNKAD